MAKKTAAKKKRTAAQKRATAALVAMNKKKRASKKKASAKKRSSVSASRPRRSAAKVRGYPGGARRTNPKERWGDESLKYVIIAIPHSDSRKRYFVKDDGAAAVAPYNAALFNTQESAKDVAAKGDHKTYNYYVAPVGIKYKKNDVDDLLS